MRRGITGLLVLSAATALLVGCATGNADTGASSTTASPVPAELAELYAAAKAEGKVVFYGNASPDAMAAVKQGFEQQFPGIVVDAVRLPDAEMIPRLETELGSGAPTADFIENASPGWLLAQGAKGAWAASDAPEAGGNGAYDAKSFFDGANKVYEVGGTVNTFAWNTDLVPDGIKDYPDLTAPALADGKVGVLELASAPSNAFYSWLKDTFGESFYNDLGAQRPRIYPSTTVIVEALGSGEIYASNWILPSLVEDAKKAGAPVDYAVSPTAPFGLHGYGVINAKAANPNAAKLLLEYVLSPEGQSLLWPLGASVVSPAPQGMLATLAELPPWDPALSTPEALTEGRAQWDAVYR